MNSRSGWLPWPSRRRKPLPAGSAVATAALLDGPDRDESAVSASPFAVMGEVCATSWPDESQPAFAADAGPRPAPLGGFATSVTSGELTTHDFSPTSSAAQCRLHTVKDAYLVIGPTNDGAVLDADRRLIIEPSAFSALAARPVRTYPCALDLPLSEQVIDAAIIGFDAAWPNYYHWLLFGLGRSWLARQSLPTETPIIFPDFAGRGDAYGSLSRATIMRSLEASIGTRTCLFLSPGVYRIGALSFLWTRPGAPTELMDAPSLYPLFDRISEALTPARERLGRHRLYFTREAGPSPRLGPEDGAAIDRVLAARGFEKVFLERLSFEQQVRCAASAEVIVSPHGAGLTNIVFSRRDALVIELHRTLDGEGRPVSATASGTGSLRPWFYQIASSRGQPYAGFNFDKPGAIDDLERALDQWLT